MEKRRTLRTLLTATLITAIITATTLPAHAAWKVVVDPYCTAAVSANLASQKLIEDQHNARLDSISSKKQKLKLYTASMATIKELYKLTMQNISGLVLETQGLVADFVNIVNNAKVQNPLGDKATTETADDGYNFLDRYERLTVANTIYSRLLNIRYKVEGMMAMAQYATLNDLLFAIDPEGWANVVTMKSKVDGLIYDWNYFTI